MSLRDALDHGLQVLPECRVIAYVDMPSGLVLGSASRVPMRQEQLDRLSVAAAALLNSPALATLGRKGGALDDGGTRVLLLDDQQACCLVRSASFPDHALCYICATGDVTVDLDRRIGRHSAETAAAL